MLALNFKPHSTPPEDIAQAAWPALRKIGIFERILRSMHLARRAQAARIIAERRYLDAPLAKAKREA